MFSNCGKSFCMFFKKLFHIDNRRISSYNISTSHVINSNDLDKYLFADECESCKNKRSKTSFINISNKNKNQENEHLGTYEPPVVIGSCDSFRSVNTEDDVDSDLDIESDNEPEQVDIESISIKSINKNKTIFKSSGCL
jgi:hypothetical protein